MEIAVIADIHSNLPALEAVLKELGDKKPIYCAGDLVGYNPFPKEVVEKVREKGIECVLGNHDHAVLSEGTFAFNPVSAEAVAWTRKNLGEKAINFLSSLPLTYTGDFFMVHGSPRRPLDEYVFPDYPEDILEGFFSSLGKEILVMGHTHIPFIKKPGDMLVLNPGSVGQPRDGNPDAAYALLDTEKKEAEIKRVEYNIDRVAEKIREARLPEILAKRLYSGW